MFSRSKAGLNPEAQKVVTQLSVMSAGRKMPKMLKLCNEDYIKHKTIMKAWSVKRKQEKEAEERSIKKQYRSIREAFEDLKLASPKLFEKANEHEYGKRFPLEMRIPTEYPPRQIWYYDYVPRKRND
ncbi:hypothetical protein FOA43_002486 [Brettanomyces nanus]|uniref:Large ribosomal subunit protein mL40 n=1 Tax=Eeniella nana TaxID=13502 RepID=A0A875S515_EENNA|nr:uncharacterized protein FOA43_002486 [Brettanomyces nanus]QPG75142.1 hypothetical protein FOA43_002486 [Brettanomyces nanus]